MYEDTRYLAWAESFFPRVGDHNLAVSGIRPFSWPEIGAIPSFDDLNSLAALRERIAAFCGVTKSEVAPALGTSQALWLAYASVLSPGDEVIVETPLYEPLVCSAEGMGAKVVFTERRADTNFAIDVDDVRSRFTAKTRAVSITNLHNPTGVRVPEKTLRELAKLCEEHGASLIVDEVYAAFDTLLDVSSGAAKWPHSARHLADNIIAVASLTKVFGAGPHRIGWMLANEKTTQRGLAALRASTGHMPYSHASIACGVLSGIEKLAARTTRELGNKRQRVAAFFTEFPEWKYSAPQDGLFGFAWNDARRDKFLRSDIEAWNARTGALVVPGEFFRAPNGFRIGWSLPEEHLDGALSSLRDLLTQK